MQTPQFSPDGQFWWDGATWQPTSTLPPQHAYVQQSVAAQPLHYQQPGDTVPTGPHMGRFARGRRIAKLCWSVLQSEKSLLILPVLAFAGFICMMLILGFPLLLSNLAGSVNNPAGEGNSVLSIIFIISFLGLMYVGSAFISSFFGAAMIGAATLRLGGEHATAADGMKIAWAHAGDLFIWSFISGTVGILIRSMENRLGVVGRIGGMVVGLTWAISTTFIIPVLIYEQSGVFNSIKRSAIIIKQRWGESLSAGVSIGFSLFLWTLLGFALSVVLFVIFPLLGIAAAILTIGIISMFNAALSGIYRAALFQYATTGTVPTHLGFTQEDMTAAFRPKGTFFRR